LSLPILSRMRWAKMPWVLVTGAPMREDTGACSEPKESPARPPRGFCVCPLCRSQLFPWHARGTGTKETVYEKQKGYVLHSTHDRAIEGFCTEKRPGQGSRYFGKGGVVVVEASGTGWRTPRQVERVLLSYQDGTSGICATHM
jgi:hypothetical protein